MQISIIRDFLKSQGWQFTEVPNNNVLLFGIAGKNGKFQCVVDLIENESKFIFFSICGINAPLKKKDVMLELLNGLNCQLFFGNFEIDLEDGEIRLRTHIPYRNLQVNEQFIEEIIMTNIIIMDKSIPAIMSLMYGDISVNEAIKKAKLEEI